MLERSKAILKYIKTTNIGNIELDGIEPGCWINLVRPTSDEIDKVISETGIAMDLLSAVLDEEERSRIEYDEDNEHTLILVDTPLVEVEENGSYFYTTLPLGIIHCPEYIVTVCGHDSHIIRQFSENKVKGLFTYKKTRFILQLLYRNAVRYLHFLRIIDRESNKINREMQKSYRNKELLQMMDLEKSLVYFSTSLHSNEMVMEKLVKVNYIKKYADDDELLEDVIIENKQAIEMCSIYRDILTGMMDAYASIISNNLSSVMKFLAAVTLIVGLITLVTSAWGMNLQVPWENSQYGFVIVSGISILVAVIAGIYLWRRKMF